MHQLIFKKIYFPEIKITVESLSFDPRDTANHLNYSILDFQIMERTITQNFSQGPEKSFEIKTVHYWNGTLSFL